MQASRPGPTSAMPMNLRASRIGYLVPGPAFIGVVQSVYARACNVASGDLLVVLVAPDIADGPTTLVLAGDRDVDLRTCFQVRDRLERRGSLIKSPGADVDLEHAVSWHPDPGLPVADPAQVAINLNVAAARLATRIDRAASVIHSEGHAVCASVEQACRDCDVDLALLDAVRLIGWGEGLTPAGDDFLVGLLAGLDGLAAPSPARAAFMARFSAGLREHEHLTTELAAHYLRLAAGGHFGADVHRLRMALLSSSDVARVARLADDALAVGATSGADLVAGLLAGISAWLPVSGR